MTKQNEKVTKKIEKVIIKPRPTLLPKERQEVERGRSFSPDSQQQHINRTRNYGTKDTDETSLEHWIEIYHINDFEHLHNQIYDIVDHIVHNKTEHNDHPFVRKWKTLQGPHNKYKLTNKMGWRAIKLCLGIEDLGQYKDFILRCPEINEYIQLCWTQKHKNTIEFGKLPAPQDTSLGYLQQDSNSSITDTTVDDNPVEQMVCTERTQDIQELLNILLPIWTLYAKQHPEDVNSHMIQEWFAL